MKPGNRLFLQEEILLLALEDRRGTIDSGSRYTYAMAGGIMAELLLHERIVLDETRRNKYVELVGDTPIGDPVLDARISRIASAKRRASLQTWVSRFANPGRLKHEVAKGLCRRGVLRADEGKVLLIFKRKIYPEIDPGPERELTERLRKAIYTEATGLDPRTVILISLARSGDVLKFVFPKKELRARRDRIEAVVNGEVTGKAAREAIQAAEAAIVVAAIMPAIMASTITH